MPVLGYSSVSEFVVVSAAKASERLSDTAGCLAESVLLHSF